MQKISGHKTKVMVARYAHANGAHIDTAMDRLEGQLDLGLTTSQSASNPGTMTQELYKAHN